MKTIILLLGLIFLIGCSVDVVDDTMIVDNLNITGDLQVGGNISGVTSDKFWSIGSVDGSGSHYIAGHYVFGGSDDNFNPSINFGGINRASGGHPFIVCDRGGNGGTDTIINISGTSINDNANRVANDFELLTVDDNGSSGAYYETKKKFLGQINIEKVSGPDILCNYGDVKYWDNINKNFTVIGFEATFIGGANDNNPNIILRHHKSTGWTYNSGSEPTPPSPIADMQTDYVTEIQIDNGENGAYKRDNINQFVKGSNSEGIIIELITTSATGRTYITGNFQLQITS